jgi:GNAT superfamily N-acetyltransferase
MTDPSPVSQHEIRRWIDLPDAERSRRDIEGIFFAASGTREFPSADAKAAFAERWLGRYLAHDAALAWVAVAADDSIDGYLVGSLDDPALTPRFADIGYFADLAGVTRRYPAHLHINLADRARNRGLGGRLVEAFVAQVRAGGLPGVHVVTGRGLRNVAFYQRLGFQERAATTYNGRPVVMLGRDVP